MDRDANSVRSRRSFIVFVAFISFIALGWRLVDVRDWPSKFYPSLQYESALVSRSIWVSISPAVRTPERVAWRDGVGTDYVVAPPLLPALVAVVYVAMGEETPWVSRLFTTGFWLAAGAFVFAASLRLTGHRWAAAIGFAWFVLCPFGMFMSRSFQTEAVLVFAFAVAIWTLARPNRTLRWRETLATTAVCSLASFSKPGILFLPLIAGFAAIILPRTVPGSWSRKAAHLALFSTSICLPGILYAVFLLKVHSGRIMPHLLGEWWYYEGVARYLWEVVGPALVLAALGMVMAARAGTYLPIALAIGHFATLTTFTFHAATHDYYQVPLLVITAIASAWPIAAVARFATNRWGHRPKIWAIGLTLGVALYLVVEREPDIGPWRWLPEKRAEINQIATARRTQAEQAAIVRSRIGTQKHVLELTPGYGYPLQFDGWLRTVKWPSVNDRAYLYEVGAIQGQFSSEKYLRHLIAVSNCEYFIVSDMQEWARQPDLQAAVLSFGPPLVSSPELLIFDVRQARMPR